MGMNDDERLWLMAMSYESCMVDCDCRLNKSRRKKGVVAVWLVSGVFYLFYYNNCVCI